MMCAHAAVRTRLSDGFLAPLVNSARNAVFDLTGFEALKTPVKVQIVNDGGKTLGGPSLLSQINDDQGFPWLNRQFDRVIGKKVLGVFCSVEQMIFLNRALCEAQSVSRLRLLLAHELVHVGQFGMLTFIVNTASRLGGGDGEVEEFDIAAIQLIKAKQYQLGFTYYQTLHADSLADVPFDPHARIG